MEGVGTNNGPCETLLKEVYCAQRFPRCSDGNVVLTSTPNCQSRLESECPSILFRILQNENFCGLEDATIPIGTCSPISEHDSDNLLAKCSFSPDTQVTDWMYRLISFTDSQLDVILSDESSLHGIGEQCSPQYARYFCQFIGQCNQDGTRIRLLNNYHSCEKVVNW